jgi:PAS domain S-box-containing protein
MSQDHPTNTELLREVEKLRGQLEQERALAGRLVHLVSSDNDLHSLMREATSLLREWSGCQALGIRLRDGDDFPYFETRGFPPQFIQAENTLCVRDLEGQLARDFQGNAVLECMCGNVLCGRFNPALPFFTPNGSFWTNSMTELLASTTEGDRQACTRNRCSGEGYESVALIPMRSGRTTLGLLQLNDRRAGRFAIERITFIEGLAAALGEAIGRRQSAEEFHKARRALCQSERRFRDLAELLPQMIYELDLGGRLTFVNRKALERFGYTQAEFEAGLSCFQMLALHERDRARDNLQRVLDGQDSAGTEYTAQRKDGTQFPVIIYSSPILVGQMRAGLRGIIVDVTEHKRAQESLRLRDRAIDVAGEGICITGPNEAGNPLVYVNRGFEQLTGYTAEEVLGKNIRFLQGPGTDQATLRQMRAAIASDQGFATEMLNYRKDATPFWNQISITPVKDTTGKVAHFVAVLHDLTKRKRAEEELTKSKAILQATIESLPFDFYAIGSDGRYFLQNTASGANWGQILGKTPEDVAPTEEIRTLWLDNNRRAFAGEKVEGEARVTVNGETRVVYNVLSPIRKGERILGILGVNIDITDRKRTEEALREKDEKYRLIVEAAVEGIWVVDAEYRTSFVNPQMADMLGYSEEEMLGRRMGDFLFEEDLSDHQAQIESRVRGMPGRYERTLRRKDGSECWTATSVTSLRDADGRFAGALGMFADIAARKADENRLAALELQLTHASRLATLGELAAGIAHEVNQPLCAIVNFAKACKNTASDEAPDLSQIRQWSETIAVAAAQSGDIVRRMLDFARKGGGTRETVTIEQLVADAMQLVRQEARADKVALRRKMFENGLAARADPVQIQQVLVNLLRNAIEALRHSPPANRRILVRARRVDGRVRVCVADNGPGQPEAELPKIFGPFFTTKPQGLGLGLAISKTIVEDHGGRIWATANQGGGLTVHFTLPADEDSPQDVPE